jgi:hydroxyethylthiazole kinase-like uncharacterized protein yjeF
MYILTTTQQTLADKATIANNGITSLDLMENAASQCFQWLHNRLQGNPAPIHIFCGIGNNGGDGLVIARHLIEHGYKVFCYVVNFSEKRSPEFLVNYNLLKEMGIWPAVIRNALEFPQIEPEHIVIDAIFGNGLARKPIGFTKKLIQHINNSQAFILSIDFPSGLYGNKKVTDKNAVIKATHILTFQSPKLAFLLPENKDYVNTWEVINIGLDEDFIASLKIDYEYITKNEVLPLYKFRNKWDHKGTFGHALIVGGSFGKIGAVILATKGALKIGSGLVSAYIPKCGYSVLQVAVPEAMVEVDADNELSYFNIKTKSTVIGIGPGLGTSEKTAIGFESFIKENKLPLVLDADALNILSIKPYLLDYLPENSVLTPHVKELERLVGVWKNDYVKLKKITAFVKKYRVILILKGAHTLVASGNNFYFNSTGNPALATGGSGDVLTGMITGLIAQGYQPLEAAVFAVYLHGNTADIALNETGYESFTASTIFEYLPKSILSLFEQDNAIENNETQETEN